MGLNQININLIYIIAAVVAVLIVFLILVIVIVKKKKNKKIKTTFNQIIIDIVSALGGKENIESLEAKGSRLNVILKNNDLLDENKVKELGVSSIIKMSKKTTLVVGEISKDIVSYVNEK